MNEPRGKTGEEKWRENMKYQIKQAALNALFSTFFLWRAWCKYPDTEVIFFVPLSICFAILAVLASKIALELRQEGLSTFQSHNSQE